MVFGISQYRDSSKQRLPSVTHLRQRCSGEECAQSTSRRNTSRQSGRALGQQPASRKDNVFQRKGSPEAAKARNASKNIRRGSQHSDGNTIARGYIEGGGGKISRRIPPPKSKSSLVVIARVQNEALHLREFPQHYFDEGAERVVLIDNDSHPPVRIAHPNVTILKGTLKRGDDERGKEMRDVEAALHTCRELGYTWAASVDADEYMTTRKHSGRTLLQELHLSFSDVDVVEVPWLLMMTSRQHDPQSVLLAIRHRWNMDIHHYQDHRSRSPKYRDRYHDIEVKPIVRLSKFQVMSSPHHVFVKPGSIIADSVVKHKRAGWKSSNTFLRLSERNISNALLLIHHYRFTSMDAIAHKCTARSALSTYNVRNKTYCMQQGALFVRPELTEDLLAHKTKRRRAARLPVGHEEPPSRQRVNISR